METNFPSLLCCSSFLMLKNYLLMMCFVLSVWSHSCDLIAVGKYDCQFVDAHDHKQAFQIFVSGDTCCENMNGTPKQLITTNFGGPDDCLQDDISGGSLWFKQDEDDVFVLSVDRACYPHENDEEDYFLEAIIPSTCDAFAGTDYHVTGWEDFSQAIFRGDLECVMSEDQSPIRPLHSSSSALLPLSMILLIIVLFM